MGRTTLADLVGVEHWPVLRGCWPKDREGHSTRLAGDHTLAVVAPRRAHLHHTPCDKVEKPLKPAGSLLQGSDRPAVHKRDQCLPR